MDVKLKPIIKRVGGKSKLVNVILEYIKKANQYK